MASAKAVAVGLATLHEAFPTRPVTAQTADVWARLFADVGDDAFLDACERAATERGRTFFPSTAELMALAIPERAIDTDRLLREMHRLGEYLPSVGVLPPRVDAVRERFGEAVALAYTEAGGAQLFASTAADGSSTTRDIARRTFSIVLQAEARKSPDLTRQLSAPAAAPSLRLPSPSDL